MSDGPTLSQQVAAVERAAANWRGHVLNLRELALRGKRPQSEHDMAAAWLPDLEGAALTMRWVANNEAVILAAVDGAKAEAATP
jgi:hypothetical protein